MQKELERSRERVKWYGAINAQNIEIRQKVVAKVTKLCTYDVFSIYLLISFYSLYRSF